MSPHIVPTTTTVDPVVAEARTAVLPVGSFEQHGPHLPLATDILVAVAIADAISRRHPVFQLPPLTFSCSHEHAAFPGTVSIRATTLAAVIADIRESLDGQGIQRLLIVNGHGGNYLLANLVQEANAGGRPRLGLYPAREDWRDARTASGMTSDAHEDMHAGELETATLLAVFPDVVRDGWQHADHTHDDRRHLLALGVAGYSKTGVIGWPSRATAEKGRVALQSLAESSDHILNILDETPADT